MTDITENCKALRKVEGILYKCMMETAWNWKKGHSEVVRNFYQSSLIEAQNILQEKNLTNLYGAIESIEYLPEKSKAAAMRVIHLATRSVWLDIQNRATQLEKDSITKLS